MTDPFTHAEDAAKKWLAIVGEHLGTEDRYTAYRMLRAWLHVVRDRLTVVAASRFGAQLPGPLRGVYYEGWTPGHVPTRYDVPGFIARFAGSAGITRAEVPPHAAAVTTALALLCSPGELERVAGQLPAGVRALLAGTGEQRREDG
ncbi:DUF2267 domain-containing protein [Amycolatopsis decaplanina]|uniref:DUF2267 domain-containing protein n=1 Tax=Amycolatopsis decaplanina DSM 44594 TaxID=1284240 RepID=M2X2B5_9PSEU|nr:DUF2267 domain-containing protein [Amycolatopsis decaplanina]EME55121.1 hypothetical protein H074_26472 [Amycolatopsis decaplanina DSM 44594]